MRKGNGRKRVLTVQLMTLIDDNLAERLQAMADHFRGPRAKLVRGILDYQVTKHEARHANGGTCEACRAR